ncbi:MAG: hypothetical protein ACK4E0_03195 [Chitinophagaceae bacterium]
MSTTIDYTKKRDNLIRQYLNEEEIKGNEFLYGQYTLVSANLLNFLPEIDSNIHMKLFMQLLVHKQLSKLEQGSAAALSYLRTENLSIGNLNALRNNPAIICTFHTGSYRIINSFLVQNKVPFALAIGNSIMAAEGEDYISIYNSLAVGDNNTGFTIIDAEHPKSGLRMLRELKSGKSLLLYMDGNSGAGNQTAKNENSCIVSFLRQQLFARKGIGFLAHAANVPIIPVINYRRGWNDIRLRFYDPIAPDPHEDRDSFSRQVTHQLYDIAADIIRQYPEQWEAWLYLHKVANISTPVKPSRGETSGQFVRFNLKDYGIFKINSKGFLFQKNSYKSYPIEESLFEILGQSIVQPIAVDNIKMATLQELEENHVLHYL